MEILNPSQVGEITELKCRIFLIEQGWNVLVPVGNYQKYDIVIEKNKKFYRIQCKHATALETGFKVRTKYEVRAGEGRTQRQRYTDEDCDYFMTEFNGKFYIFPLWGTTETKFWTVPPKLTQPNCKLAKDFRAEDILKTL